MHSHFPHPKDCLVILHVQGRFDEADHQGILSLLRDRMLEHDKIWIFLWVQNPNFDGTNLPAWVDPLLEEDVRIGIERLALITPSASTSWFEMLIRNLPDAELRQFAENDQENALHWVQTGAFQ